MNEAQRKAIQFQKDYDAGQDIRDQANEDMRFITISGGMWEGFLETAYADRPRMEYNMLEKAVDKFMGEWEENDVMPKFRGEEEEDDDSAELIGGRFRAVWRDRGGEEAIKIAVYEAAATGFGAVRIATSYLDEEDVDSEKQDIDFIPVHSAYSTVVYDRSAKKIDKSDARHVSVLVPYTEEEVKEMWPDKNVVSAPIQDRSLFNWTCKDTVYVIEHYEIKKVKKRVNVYMNEGGGKLYIEDKDVEASQDQIKSGGYRKVRSKNIKKTWVEKSVLSGGQYLEEPRKIIGKRLPVVPFYAKFNIVDGMEVYRGIVRKEKDPSRILNVQLSKLTEQSATTPKEVPIFAPTQVDGLERRWSQAHLGNKNYQLAKPLVDSRGNVISAGPLGYLKPPQIDPATQGLIQFTSDYLRESSGSLPKDIEDPNASGKALLAAQKRVDMLTYSMMGNMVVGMREVGRVYISMCQDIYSDTRKVRIISEDGTARSVVLNQGYVEGGLQKTKNSFVGKRFKVYSDTGKSYQAQRRETVDFLKELAQILPEGDPRQDAVISSIIDNMEGAGLDVVKEFNRRNMLITGLIKPEEGNEEEEALVASIQEQQNQPDATQQLIESQASLNYAEAESKQAANIDKMASADKKQAETVEILQGMELDKAKLILDALDKQQRSSQ